VFPQWQFTSIPPSVTEHCVRCKTTFLALTCEGLKNDTMWDALRAKGAKVGSAGGETVLRTFNEARSPPNDRMLPTCTLRHHPLDSRNKPFDALANKW